MDPEQIRSQIEKLQEELRLAEERASNLERIKQDPRNADLMELNTEQLEKTIKEAARYYELCLEEKVHRKRKVDEKCKCLVYNERINYCDHCHPYVSR